MSLTKRFYDEIMERQSLSSYPRETETQNSVEISDDNHNVNIEKSGWIINLIRKLHPDFRRK
jgi:hypothetical protein